MHFYRKNLHSEHPAAAQGSYLSCPSYRAILPVPGESYATGVKVCSIQLKLEPQQGRMPGAIHLSCVFHLLTVWVVDTATER